MTEKKRVPLFDRRGPESEHKQIGWADVTSDGKVLGHVIEDTEFAKTSLKELFCYSMDIVADTQFPYTPVDDRFLEFTDTDIEFAKKWYEA